jgi:hypothetical protein
MPKIVRGCVRLSGVRLDHKPLLWVIICFADVVLRDVINLWLMFDGCQHSFLHWGDGVGGSGNHKKFINHQTQSYEATSHSLQQIIHHWHN